MYRNETRKAFAFEKSINFLLNCKNRLDIVLILKIDIQFDKNLMVNQNI